MLAARTALGDGAEGCAAIPAQRPQLESNQNPGERISTAPLIRGTRPPDQHGGTSRPNKPRDLRSVSGAFRGAGATGPCRVWAEPATLSAQRRRRESALASFGAAGTVF